MAVDRDHRDPLAVAPHQNRVEGDVDLGELEFVTARDGIECKPRVIAQTAAGLAVEGDFRHSAIVPYGRQVTRADDIETIERIYEAWNQGALARIAERYWSERIEWHDPPELERGGIYVGRERVIGRVVSLAADIGVPLLRVEQITVLAGEYIVELDFDVVPAAAELPPGTIATVHVIQIADGRVDRLRTFVTADAAFAALAAQAARA